MINDVDKIFNSGIKVLIVDDEYTNTEEMIHGLEKFNLDYKNIFPNKESKDLKNFSKLVKDYAEKSQVLELYTLLKSIIQLHKIDLLFLDLHLSSKDSAGKSTGEEIIEKFTEDDYFYSTFPIVVVSVYSKEELKKGSPVLAPMLHIKKPNINFDEDEFVKSIEKERLNEYWINIVKNHRKIKDSKDYRDNIEFIKKQLDRLNNEDKLNNILESINGINSNLLLSEEKLKTIEIMSKTIITVLPQLTEKKYVKQVINKLDTNEIREILGEEFPIQVCESIYQKLKAKVNSEKDAFIGDIYSEIKDLIKNHIKEESKILESDDIVEKTGKFTIYVYGKIISLLTGKI
ncbi:response regulator [Aliarcobacter butzleri]|uniref:response regulator n=1 Tax=Aliarcobacter butzleri TaxID=28197 RepID=UPI0021B2C389|nr:response regulator [Aliarcobacter butzleri]MCT7555349.1 response regulator [Aliarcobacter butzleri]